MLGRPRLAHWLFLRYFPKDSVVFSLEMSWILSLTFLHAPDLAQNLTPMGWLQARGCCALQWAQGFCRLRARWFGLPLHCRGVAACCCSSGCSLFYRGLVCGRFFGFNAFSVSPSAGRPQEFLRRALPLVCVSPFSYSSVYPSGPDTGVGRRGAATGAPWPAPCIDAGFGLERSGRRKGPPFAQACSCAAQPLAGRRPPIGMST